MGASPTALPVATGEHQKARYRLLVFGFLALFGPPAFGIEIGVLPALYGFLLVLYSLWGLRLTVVFDDDEGLGYLLTLFDVAMTLPLVVWGDTPWLAAPVVALWVVGLSVSAMLARGRRARRLERSDHLVDPSTGFLNSSHFGAAVDEEARLAAVRGKCFSLVLVKIQRFGEIQACYGAHVAERSMGVVARRSLRAAGADAGADGYRLGQDLVALLLPGCEAAGAAELAVAISRSVGGRLLDGHKLDCEVGYATAPRDGSSARQLLAAAAVSAATARSGRVKAAGGAAFGRTVADQAAV